MNKNDKRPGPGATLRAGLALLLACCGADAAAIGRKPGLEVVSTVHRRIGANDCQASEPARDDPDRFVAELQAWPQARLQYGNYATGVMTTLVGEMRYPGKALGFSMNGSVELTFVPSVPRVDVKTLATEEGNMYGLIDGNDLRDRKSSSVTKGFEVVAREITQRALKRYPQPAGIDPKSELQVRFDFGIERC
jgi:hypothetical protein